MKIKRYKKVNKHLNFYINNFNFRQPYQLLIDGTFCFAALNNKVNINDNIPRYLQGEAKLLTTQCAIIEMESLGKKLSGALLILKKYKIHKCGHEAKPVSAAKCLRSMLKNVNENHYIIATQDRDLQEKVRNGVGVPLLYLHGKAPVLEEPSDTTKKAVKDKLAGISRFERQRIDLLKEKTGVADTKEPIIKKKKIKGANPLSCLRRKPKQSTGKVEKSEAKRRKKVRISKHVKEELLKIKS